MLICNVLRAACSWLRARRFPKNKNNTWRVMRQGRGDGPVGYATGVGLSASKTNKSEPVTVAALFFAGRLGPEAETALEEIRGIGSGFTQFVSPTKGWLTPRLSDNRPDMPRLLGRADRWRRYCAWRGRCGGGKCSRLAPAFLGGLRLPGSL